MTKKRAKPKRIVKPRSRRHSRLTARQKQTRKRCRKLLFDLAHAKGPFTKLLHEYHLSSRTAHKYLGDALEGGGRGHRVRARKTDNRVRTLMFPTALGDVPKRVTGLEAASTLSYFYNDRGKLVRDQMSANDFETKWLGARVADQELFADTTEILRMANAGELKMDNLYASTVGKR